MCSEIKPNVCCFRVVFGLCRDCFVKVGLILHAADAVVGIFRIVRIGRMCVRGVILQGANAFFFVTTAGISP